MSDDEALAALSSHRDRKFAELLTVAIGLAAEQAPDVLRAALAKVFDFTGIEQRAAEAERRAREAFTTAEGLCIEARHLIDAIHETLAQVERRFDKLGKVFKQLEKRATALEGKP